MTVECSFGGVVGWMEVDGRMKRLGIKECGLVFQKLNHKEHKRNRVVFQGRHSMSKLLKYGSYAHGCMLKKEKFKSKKRKNVEKIEHNEEKG